METAKAVTDFLTRVTAWAAHQPTISGVVLVGSHARGEARPDSDFDLVLLCTARYAFLAETSWIHRFGAVEICHTEEWGVVTSLRVYYTEGVEVEFGLTTLAWVELPVDPGTQYVVSHGMRILWDREGMLGRLWEAVAAS
jgi:predicted nucleotidyltransferase